jgi:uncharacterized protein
MDTLSLAQIALLASAGLIAGAVNAIAGGGTFFTFSALIATGLPPIIANATSSVAITPGNITGALAYHREIRHHARRFIGLILVSLAGGFLGAALVLLVDNQQFRALVPWFLGFATLLFTLGPRIQAWTRKTRAQSEPSARPNRLWGRLFQFCVATYGGFFGAGMGIVMLAGLAITEGEDHHVLTALKNLLAMVIQLVAMVIFVAGGLVSWPHCLAITAAAMLGGWLGGSIARKLPAKIVRQFVIVVGAALTVIFSIR